MTLRSVEILIFFICVKEEDKINPIILFIMAVIVCCILEYYTSYVMEKLFHTR